MLLVLRDVLDLSSFSRAIKSGLLLSRVSAPPGIRPRITKLKEQLEVITKQKARKRKRIQHSGTIEYSKASAQVAAEASTALQLSKKACSREG